MKKIAELGFAMTAIAVVIAGCGGNSVSPLSGTVADGYISGAKVCLDTNSNGVCDTGEPSATTGSNGQFMITSGYKVGQDSQYAYVAEVPATAIDTGTAVGQPFTLTAPVGTNFLSPLSTLVQEKVAAGASVASAVASVGQALAIPAASGVSVLDDYVAKKGTATDQSNGYFRAQEAARTVAAVLKLGKGVVGSTSASTDRATQSALLAEAEKVLLAQAVSNAAAAGTLFSPAAVSPSSIAGAGTLKTAIAANNAVNVSATQAVTINFDVVKGAAVIGTTGCSSTTLTLGNGGMSGVPTPGQIKDLRFYVSNVALIDAAGNYAPVVLDVNANQDKNVALLDFEDATGSCLGANATAATYTALSGKVAPGNYVGIALTLGVPERLNHTDPAAAATPAPLKISAMNWSWQSGRKFTKIEFTSTAIPAVGAASAVPAATTMVHLGSTDCKANPAVGDIVNGCGSPNRLHISFANFNPSTQKIALDLGALFGGEDLATSRTWMSSKPTPMGMGGGMMSMGGDPVYYFNKFQIDPTTGLPINDGAAQTLFVIR